MPPPIDRRTMLGAFGSSILAGCTGDADDRAFEAATPGSPVSAAEEPERVRDPDGVERYDVMVRDVYLSDPPPDISYQQYAGPLPPWNEAVYHVLVSRSYADAAFYGELVADWSYDDQVLTVDLHNDFSYWDGSPVDAENVRDHWELDAAVERAMNEEDPRPAVDALEVIEDYRFVAHLDAPRTEDAAIEASIADWHPKGASSYYQPYLDDLADAGDDDEREAIALELTLVQDDNPDPFYYAPFRIVNIREEDWTFLIRANEEPVPHFVGDFSYRWIRLQIALVEEGYRATREHLMAVQDRPYFRSLVGEPGWDFAVEQVRLPAYTSPWALLFNTRTPPFDDVHVRRAIIHLLDRDGTRRAEFHDPNRHQTPFIHPRRADRFISDDVLASVEEFHWNESNGAAATAEMKRAGLERDATGRWVIDDQPATVTLWLQQGLEYVHDHTEAFRSAARDWGFPIELDMDTDDFDERVGDTHDFDLAATVWGGPTPEVAIGRTFDPDAGLPGGNPGLPSTVEAPPVGTIWPEADELVAYDIPDLLDRMRDPTAPDARQTAIDELCWLANQLCVRVGIEGEVDAYDVNDERYTVSGADEVPESWLRPPAEGALFNGAISYVG